MTQREIKLRAWDEKNKIMHYNFQFIKSGNDVNDWIIFVSDNQQIEKGLDAWSKNPYFQQQLKIMKYTERKDKNGKEIYEGDFFKYKNNGKTIYTKEVIWNEKTLTWQIKDDVLLWALRKDCEYAGNIFENENLIDNNKIIFGDKNLLEEQCK